MHYASKVDLADTLNEVVRHINWILDVDLKLEATPAIEGEWRRPWIKETVWLLSEALLPFADPKETAVVRGEERNGWAQISFKIPGMPFSSEELADLAQHCHGRRFNGRHSFKRNLVRKMDETRRIAEAQGGSLSITGSESGGTVATVTLPIQAGHAQAS